MKTGWVSGVWHGNQFFWGVVIIGVVVGDLSSFASSVGKNAERNVRLLMISMCAAMLITMLMISYYIMCFYPGVPVFSL